MKYFTKLTNVIIIILATISLSSQSQAAIISLSTDSNEVLVGENLEIDIVISQLEDSEAPALSTYDIDLMLNSDIFALTGVRYGNFLDVLGLGNLQIFTPSGDDKFNIFELSFDFPEDLIAFQPDSFILATLELMSISTGTGEFALNILALGDENGDSIDASSMGTSISVVAPVNKVDEPLSFSFIFFALLLMLIRRCRAS